MPLIRSKFSNSCYEEIKYSPKLDDSKSFEKNNPTIAFNILYTKEKEILPVYILNHYSIFEKQTILLMILNEEKGWHYLAVR